MRADILKVNRAKNQARAKESLGVEDFLVVIMGGSLGSKKLNLTVLELLKNLGEYPNLNIYHIVGDRDWEWFEKQLESAPSNFKAVKFKEDMTGLYEAADLFVTRAGAGVISELEVTKTPAILIPLPNAPGNHQMENAKAFVDACTKSDDTNFKKMKSEGEEMGSHVVILEEQNLNPKYLLDELKKHMEQTKYMPESKNSDKDSGETLEQSHHFDSVKAIVDLMEAHAKRH